MTVHDDLATRGDERIPEIVRAWERAQAVMPPANPTDPDDPNTALATLAAIAHAKWRRAEAAEAKVARLRDGLRDLHTEVDCRIEHGAESGGHLEYVRERLRLLSGEDGAA